MALLIAFVWTKDKTLPFHIKLFAVVLSRGQNVGMWPNIFEHVSETYFVRIKAQKYIYFSEPDKDSLLYRI